MQTKELIVITGAASGIGCALVNEYLSYGYKVAGLDIKPSTNASKNYFSYTVDVSNEEALSTVAQRIKTDLGQPFIWINNAGIAALGPFEKLSSASFQRVLDVNLNGVIYGTRIALYLMRDPVRGKIVNISSVNGSIPVPFMTPYVAAKHAVEGFTRALQEEKRLAHSPIQILLVSPGFVDTAIMQQENAGFVFPHWLSWMVADAPSVAKEIVDEIEAGKLLIQPTAHAKWFRRMHRMMPNLVARSSRVLVARGWKQMIGLDPIRK